MTQYILVFFAGLAGSLHCVGMCGGFACALGADPRGRAATLRRHLLYNAGRVTTYVFLGSLVGALGAALVGTPGSREPLLLVQRALAFVAGALMIVIGLQFAGLGRLRRGHGPALGLGGQALAHALRGLLKTPGPGAPLALGVFNGFLPCPLVYAFLAHTAALCLSDPGRAVATGALTMAAFGLGTFPALLLTGWLGQVLRPLAFSPQWRRRGVQLAGVFILLLGTVTILRGTLPPGGHLIHAARAQDGASASVGPGFVLRKDLGGPFSLIDHHGRAVTDQDFRGRFLLIYFGYTSCPDVCPTELSKMAAALDSLGAAAAAVQPLFITVDPARDSIALLAGYVTHFHPRLIGLTGTPAQLAAAQAIFGVHSSVSSDAQSEADGSYFMNHSVLTFFMGRDGRHLESFLAGTTVEAMAARMQRHIELDFVKGFLLRPVQLSEAYDAFAAGDYAAALAAYEAAAETGDAAAQNNLGILYEVGAGIAADTGAAEHWYRRAAEQGLPMGQYNLGILYGTGPPNTRDSVHAYAWLSLAGEHGLAPAGAARQAIAARMSASEIEEARQLVERWRPTAP